jgi:hypothetical protein
MTQMQSLGGRISGAGQGTLVRRLWVRAAAVGLDHYQVRSWRAWHAHITLSMLALAWLAASRAQAAKGEPAPVARA